MRGHNVEAAMLSKAMWFFLYLDISSHDLFHVEDTRLDFQLCYTQARQQKRLGPGKGPVNVQNVFAIINIILFFTDARYLLACNISCNGSRNSEEILSNMSS